MNINSPKRPFLQLRLHAGRDARELTNYFTDQKKQGMKLILVVIPGFPADVYRELKYHINSCARKLDHLS